MTHRKPRFCVLALRRVALPSWYLYTYTYIYICIYIYKYIYMYTCIYTYILLMTHSKPRVCVLALRHGALQLWYVYVCIHIYVCIYVYTYMPHDSQHASQLLWYLHIYQKNIAYTTLQHTATHCNTLQHTATHCNTLQHIAYTKLAQITCTYTRKPGVFASCCA